MIQPLTDNLRMTSPPEEITVQCPKCGHVYEDWCRSVNLDLDRDFDEQYLEECSSAICPKCSHKVYFDNLIVRNGVWQFGFRSKRKPKNS